MLAAAHQQSGRLPVPCAPSSTSSFNGGKLVRPQPSQAGTRPGSRRLVVQARKLSHLRRKLWKEAGPPPDLATRLFSERIIYLGMPIDSSVAELLTAQLFVLVQEAPDPIYFYINSTGIAKSNTKYGNEHEAIAVYHMMRGVEKFCPIYTLCLGNAFGEAALLLAAGSKAGNPREDTHNAVSLLHNICYNTARGEMLRRSTQAAQAKYLALSTGKEEEDVMRDFSRPRYFSPFEAVGYGLIDTVLEPKDGKVVYRDWDKMGSEISEAEVFDDDEQPLPQNVMYPGTSDYWPSDGSL
eukprot:gene6748-6968_t